jgi:hypothetical protein
VSVAGIATAITTRWWSSNTAVTTATKSDQG